MCNEVFGDLMIRFLANLKTFDKMMKEKIEGFIKTSSSQHFRVSLLIV